LSFKIGGPKMHFSKKKIRQEINGYLPKNIFHISVKKIYKWLNVDFIYFEECFISIVLMPWKRIRIYTKVLDLIWLAIVWSLWRTCNNTIFRGEVVNLSSIVDKISFIYWFWFIVDT
jgi:hypothetical protein